MSASNRSRVGRIPPTEQRQPEELDRNSNHNSAGAGLTPAACWWYPMNSWVHRHRDTLWLLDASASRLLSLWPVQMDGDNNDNDTARSSWRPVAWGLLELHRLLLDWTEEQQQQEHPNSNSSSCGSGTSVQVTPPPAYAAQLRWALTALQTLAPVALELVSTRSSNQQQQAKVVVVRRTVERIRFVLRLTLLLKYWKQLHQQQQQQQQSSYSPSWTQVSVPPGLLLQGGRVFFDHQSNVTNSIPTLEQEQYRIQRNQNVGPRTGRTLRIPTSSYSNNNNNNNNNNAYSTTSTTTTTTSTDTIRWRTYVGELLYILRPLLQAELEAVAATSTASLPSQRLLQHSWMWGLVLDLLSLQCLRVISSTSTVNNPATVQEWNRRRMRLLLYLLRAPVTHRVTEPVIQRVANVAQQRIPLVGGWVHNYLWDTLYYWKEYRLEEG